MKKIEKIKLWGIIIMILVLIAGFILLFLGHYGKAFLSLVIFVFILDIISNWLQADNEVYIHEQNYKNHHK